MVKLFHVKIKWLFWIRCKIWGLDKKLVNLKKKMNYLFTPLSFILKFNFNAKTIFNSLLIRELRKRQTSLMKRCRYAYA
ncbi:hypothetical protein CW752_11095 [Chryseobacterium sp. PMSZPI]|nr:hypothetical protein CW752_11095 [Chryseobacterium sp. PMSZPI]